MRQKDIEKKIAELHASGEFPWNTENDNRASRRREQKAIRLRDRQLATARKNNLKDKGVLL